MSVEVNVPNLGESVSEAVVGKLLKKPGESVKQDEAVAELDTDKVSVEVYSPVDGVVEEFKAAEGDTLKPGDVVVLIREGAAQTEEEAANRGDGEAREEPVSEEPAPPEPSPEEPSPEPAEEPEPAAARGNGGMQTVRRVEPPSVRRRRRAQARRPESRPEPRPATHPEPSEDAEDVVTMSPIRKRIAQRLVQAQQEAAVLTTFNEIDMSELMALRARHKEEFLQRHGVKLGFMSFFVKGVVETLRDFRGLNAEIRGDDIVYKNHHHIGVAIGSGRGLVVPVIRDADVLSFAEIEQSIVDYVDKVKSNELQLDDLQGGTFTISNGGVYGSMLSTPLLNYPQTGILGMHNIVRRPVALEDDRVEVRPIMYVALSYDHRVVDGREAVQFLVGLKQRIESPARLMFDL